MSRFLESEEYSVWWVGGNISRIPSCRGPRLSLMGGCVVSGCDHIGLGSELVCGRIGSRPGLALGVMSGHTSGLVSDSELEIRVYTVFSLQGYGPS